MPHNMRNRLPTVLDFVDSLDMVRVLVQPALLLDRCRLPLEEDRVIRLLKIEHPDNLHERAENWQRTCKGQSTSAPLPKPWYMSDSLVELKKIQR